MNKAARIPVTFIVTPPRVVAISARVDFLSLDGVRSVFGLNSEKVLAMVEDGRLLWVFTLASHRAEQGMSRGLRFWVNEIADPQTVKGMALPQVIDSILGSKAFFTRGELVHRWITNRCVLCGLVRRDLPEENGRITRASLAGFLARRWVGANRGGAS